MFRWLKREREIEVIYLNASLECEEALRAVEEAYARVADQNNVLASIVRNLAEAGAWNYADLDIPSCATCGRDIVDELDRHNNGCPVGAAVEWVAANPEDGS